MSFSFYWLCRKLREQSHVAKIFGVFAFLCFYRVVAFGAPTTLTYQGRILKADGTPLEYSAVSFIFQVTDPTGQCVVYQEQVDGINMANSAGVFDVPIGSGTVNFPTSGSFTVLDAFNNSVTLGCSGGSSNYTPSADDNRKLRVQFYDGSGWKLISPDNVIRSVPFAGYAASAQKLGTNVASDFVLKAGVNSGATCDSGSFLTWNASTQTFGCSSVSGASGGTVTNVSSANSYLSVVNGSAAPVLTVNVGQVANTVAAGNDARITNAIQSGAAAGGDLAGTYPNPSVAKILNTGLSFSSLSSGQFLKYNGTNWVNSNIAQSDVTGLSTALSGVVMQSQFPASCAASQTLTFISPSGSFSCSSIAINGSQVSGNISGNAAGFTGSLAGDVSGTQGGTSVDKIKGIAVSAAAPTSNQVLQYDGTNWTPATISTTPTGSAGGDLSGTYPNPSVATIGGSTAANVHSAEVLANAATNANTASTIVKRDASGNFTAGTITANLTGAASANVLKTGDSMSGNLIFDNTKGSVYTDTGSNTVSVTGPSSAIGTSYVLRLPTGQGSANQVLTNDGSGNLSWTTPSSTASSYTGVLPIANGGTNSSTALTNGKIMVSSGGAIVEGADTSTLQTTTLADGKILVGNSSNVATAVTPSSDVSMADTGAFTVTKIQGTSVSATSPTNSGQVLRYNGSSWTPNFVSMADLRSTITGASALTSCASNQTLTWSAATDNLACSNISVSASNFGSQAANTFLAAPNGSSGTPTFRGIASADLPASGVTAGTYKSVIVDTYGRVTAGTNPTTAGGYGITDAFVNGGNSFGGAATLGTNDNNTLALKTNNNTRMTLDTGGNVGIGTTSPPLRLSVSGEVQVGTTGAACNATNAGALQYASGLLQYCNGTAWGAVSANPAGSIVAYGASTCPNGWLVADGSAVSRTSYAALFSAIGTTFGAGDGSTTFNLPDLRGQFIRGWDNGRGLDSGRTFGTSQAGSNVVMPGYIAGGGAGLPASAFYDRWGWAGSTYDYGLLANQSPGTTVHGTAIPAAGNSQIAMSYSTSSTNDYVTSFNILSGTRPTNLALAYCINTATQSSTTVASSGSGTANYVPVWTSSTGLGNSAIAISGSNVGIGTASPGVALDVNGGIRAGSSTAVTSCGSGAANGEGTQRYNYTTHNMEYCNGTTWVGAGTTMKTCAVTYGGSTGAAVYPCNGNTCTTKYNDLNSCFTGISRTGTGTYTVTMGSIFSSTPVCIGSPTSGGLVANVYATSTTNISVAMDTNASGGGYADAPFSLLCTGY